MDPPSYRHRIDACAYYLGANLFATLIIVPQANAFSRPNSEEKYDPPLLKAETLKTSQKRKQTISLSLRSFKSSPRHISTGQLNALLQLHTRPINLIFFKVSYQITL